MIVVGCAGFAVPATRYFKEYAFVEVQETYQATPGSGTLRRWRREAPPDFRFALLAPRSIGQEGFKLGKVVETALAELTEVAAELGASTVVLTAPVELTATRNSRPAVRELLLAAKERFAQVVFELPAWDPTEADTLAEETGTLAARDPLKSGLSSRPLAYYRLPGPAGYKSRYEEPAIEDLVAQVNHEQEATYVFCNVDMFTDAKRFRKGAGV